MKPNQTATMKSKGCQPGKEKFSVWGLRDFIGIRYEFIDPADNAVFSGIFHNLAEAKAYRNRWINARRPI